MGPTLASSLALALCGAVLGLYGLIGAMAGWNHPELDPPVGRMVIMFVGACMLSVGAMMLLVVTVRPMFEKRDVDHIADEIEREQRLGR